MVRGGTLSYTRDKGKREDSMGQDDQQQRAPSTAGRWIGRKLKLESQQWSQPKTVEVLGYETEDLVVRLTGELPGFGEVVQLRAPGPRGAGIWLTGEVVVFERIRDGGSGVKVTIQLVEPAAAALARLPADAPATDMLPPAPEHSLIDEYLRQYTRDSAIGGLTGIVSPTPSPPEEQLLQKPATPLVIDVPRSIPVQPKKPPELSSYRFTDEAPRIRPQMPQPQDTDDDDEVDIYDEPSTEQSIELAPEPSLEWSAPHADDASGEWLGQGSDSWPEELSIELTSRPPDEPYFATDASTHEGAPRTDGPGVRTIGSRASASRERRKVAKALGIDFGTAYSKVAVLDGDEVVLIEDRRSTSSSRAAIPSVVALSSDGRVLVGDAARQLLAVSPERVISSVKRVMGLSYSDPLANGLLGSLACETVDGPNDSILFDIDGQQLTVPEVAARILEYAVGLASDWAGERFDKAVMTIPVDFDDRARRELELAARMAGITVISMLPEPVAAVMGVGVEDEGDSTVAVFDFGGGTFDASLVSVGQQRFEVLGAAGDRWLGGDDLDELLARHVSDAFQRAKGIALHNRQEEFRRLLFACEETKRLLTMLPKVDVILPNAGITAEGPQVLMVPVTRDEFDDLAQDVIASAIETSRQATVEAGRTPKDVDVLLLTGGTSRIPEVRRQAEQCFGRKGITSVHPEHAVVMGAAIEAALETGEELPAGFAGRLRAQARPGRALRAVFSDGSELLLLKPDQAPPVTVHHQLTLPTSNATIEIVEEAPTRREIGALVIDGLEPSPTVDLYLELTTNETLRVTVQDRRSGQQIQQSFELR